MCWMAAVPFIMQGASMALNSQSSESAKAQQVDAMRKNKWEMVKQMNIENANLELEKQDLWDSVSKDMTEGNMQRVRNMGTLRAALGESMLEGKSMDRIKNVAEGDALREQAGITDNYTRDYSKIFAKQISNTDQTKAKIDAMVEPKVRSQLSQLVDPLGIGVEKILKWGTIGAPISGKAGKKIGQKVDKPAN